MTIAYKALSGLLLLIAVASGGFYAGHHAEANLMQAKVATMQRDEAKALAAFQAKALTDHQAQEQKYAQAQATYEKEKSDAKAAADRNLADLRAGTLKLRNEWSCTPQLAAAVSKAANAGPGTDAAADLRYKDASDIVRLADDADAQIRVLQAALRADHGQ